MSTTITSLPQSASVAQALPEGFIWQNRHSVGDNLFQDGYRVSYRNEVTLWVRKPDGTRYIVNPYLHTCTCPAGSRGLVCKHSHALLDLVWLSAQLLDCIGKGDEAKLIWEFWSDYTAGGRN